MAGLVLQMAWGALGEVSIQTQCFLNGLRIQENKRVMKMSQ